MNALIWNPQALVRDFHEKFNLPRADFPDLGTARERVLRGYLLDEEVGELLEALEEGDLAHIAREMADVLYIVYGSAVTMGIDLEDVFEEVHRANMTKVGGRINEAGKLTKPPGWQPLDIESIIERQIDARMITGDR